MESQFSCFATHIVVPGHWYGRSVGHTGHSASVCLQDPSWGQRTSVDLHVVQESAQKRRWLASKHSRLGDTHGHRFEALTHEPSAHRYCPDAHEVDVEHRACIRVNMGVGEFGFNRHVPNG